MAGQFVIKPTNFVVIHSEGSCLYPRYRSWIHFLNEHSLGRYASLASPDFQIDACTPTLSHFSFRVGDTVYQVDENDFNKILQLPENDFSPLPDDGELMNFFSSINYQGRGELKLTRLIKNNLVKEWDFFFDTLSKVFAPKTGGYHGLTQFVQTVGYVVATNLKFTLES